MICKFSGSGSWTIKKIVLADRDVLYTRHGFDNMVNIDMIDDRSR